MLQLLPLILGMGSKIDMAWLQSRVSTFEKGVPHARLGVAVKDLRAGETWAFRGNERFPMQSVFKFPLGVVVLRKVDRGELSLDREVTVRRQDLSVPYSQINERFGAGPKRYTVRRLVELAVGSSDNTAADLLMKMAGGPDRVQSELDRMGVRGIRIDRYERDLQRDNAGLGAFRPEWTEESKLSAAVAAVPRERQVAAIRKYLADPRDTATPLGMLTLLEGLQAGKWLTPKSRTWLLGVMAASTTGRQRLRAGLPSGSAIAHKTGTGRSIAGRVGAVNDAGIVTLPDGRRLAIVAFLTGAGGTGAQREKVLAEVARAAVQAFRRSR